VWRFNRISGGVFNRNCLVIWRINRTYFVWRFNRNCLVIRVSIAFRVAFQSHSVFGVSIAAPSYYTAFHSHLLFGSISVLGIFVYADVLRWECVSETHDADCMIVYLDSHCTTVWDVVWLTKQSYQDCNSTWISHRLDIIASSWLCLIGSVFPSALAF
jgi:hypothetical protein